MIDIETRLRRAVNLNDILLVQRILKNHPEYLRNPDYEDHSNTSMHLAAKLGYVDLVNFFIETGHEENDISLNTEFETPLALALEAKQLEVARILIATFPRCVPWVNNKGQDALMLASRAGLIPLLPLILTGPYPANPSLHDSDGNTALHHASAAGELKALRILLQVGASPLAQNAYSWTPVALSSTPAAEAYFKQLVAEMERRRVENAAAAAAAAAQAAAQAAALQREREREREMSGSAMGEANNSLNMSTNSTRPFPPVAGRTVRIVTAELNDDGPRAASAAGHFGEFGVGEWSPVTAVNERRVMTPVERTTKQPVGESGWSGYGRRRAESGE